MKEGENILEFKEQSNVVADLKGQRKKFSSSLKKIPQKISCSEYTQIYVNKMTGSYIKYETHNYTVHSERTTCIYRLHITF